jgi:hypothetical protein
LKRPGRSPEEFRGISRFAIEFSPALTAYRKEDSA